MLGNTATSTKPLVGFKLLLYCVFIRRKVGSILEIIGFPFYYPTFTDYFLCVLDQRWCGTAVASWLVCCWHSDTANFDVLWYAEWHEQLPNSPSFFDQASQLRLETHFPILVTYIYKLFFMILITRLTHQHFHKCFGNVEDFFMKILHIYIL